MIIDEFSANHKDDSRQLFVDDFVSANPRWLSRRKTSPFCWNGGPQNGLGNATWLKSLHDKSKKLQPGLSLGVEKLAVNKKKSCPTCYLIMPRHLHSSTLLLRSSMFETKETDQSNWEKCTQWQFFPGRVQWATVFMFESWRWKMTWSYNRFRVQNQDVLWKQSWFRSYCLLNAGILEILVDLGHGFGAILLYKWQENPTPKDFDQISPNRKKKPSLK